MYIRIPTPKPSQPYNRAFEPREFIPKSIDFATVYTTGCEVKLSDILKEVCDRGIDEDTVDLYICTDHDGCVEDISLSYREQVVNPNYDKEVAAYQRANKLYEEELAYYNKQLALWEEDEKKSEEDFERAQFERLKEKYG